MRPPRSFGVEAEPVKVAAVVDATVHLHLACGRAEDSGEISRVPAVADRELIAVVRPGNLHDHLAAHLSSVTAQTRGVRVDTTVDQAAAAGATRTGLLPLLAASLEVHYLVGYAPVAVTVLDRRAVMLTDAAEAGRRGLDRTLYGGDVVRAALRYVDAVRATAAPAHELVLPAAKALTRRQHAVACLLAEDHDDTSIGRELGVSLRTVHSDVADLCRALGVSTRFAAGKAYARLCVAAPN